MYISRFAYNYQDSHVPYKYQGSLHIPRFPHIHRDRYTYIIIIQHIVTQPKYGHAALNIRRL